MIFIAFAKEVQINGRESVSSSPLNASNKKKEVTERKKSIQYKPVDFLVVSML